MNKTLFVFGSTTFCNDHLNGEARTEGNCTLIPHKKW